MKELQVLLLMFSVLMFNTSLMAAESDLLAYVFKVGMSEYENYAFIEVNASQHRLGSSSYYWENYPAEYYGKIDVSNTLNSPVCLQTSNTLLFDITTSVGKNMYLTVLSSISQDAGSNDIQLEKLKFFYDNENCLPGTAHAKLTRIMMQSE